MSKNKNLSGNLFTKTILRQSEASLSSAVAKFLDRKNIFHLRLNSGKLRVSHPSGRTSWVTLCQTGTPDRFFIYRGYHVFLELKKQGEKPTPEQLAIHDQIKQSGGFVSVVTTLDDLVQLINKIEKTV